MRRSIGATSVTRHGKDGPQETFVADPDAAVRPVVPVIRRAREKQNEPNDHNAD